MRQAWGWQNTFVARYSRRAAPCVHTIVGSGHVIESGDEVLHQYLFSAKSVKTWLVLVLVLVLAVSSLVRPLFG